MTRPVVVGLKKTVFLNSSIAASDLFNLIEGSNPVTTYYFEDFNIRATSGYFMLNGVALQQGVRFQVTAAELANLRYMGGTEILSEKIRIYVRDSAGQVSDVAMTAQAFTVRANTTPPWAKATAFSVVANEFVVGSQFVSGWDPDGHPIVSFQIRDTKSDLGYFELDGVRQTQREFFTVNADDLGKLRYYAIGAASTEEIEVRSFDGVHHSPVSRAVATIIPNISRPIVRYVFTTLQGLGNTTLNLAATTLVTDADQNTMKRYQFYNTSLNPNHGEIVFKGVVQPRQTWITVDAADFGEIMFVTKNANFTQTISYNAFDGLHWSAGINRIDIQTNFVIPPTKPIFRPTQPEFYESQRQSRSLSSMFSKQDAGVPYTMYEILDPTPDLVTGYFATNGIRLPGGSIRQLTPGQFANSTYVTAAYEDHRRESVYIRAYNGQFWGDWEKVDITTYPELWNGLNSGASWFNQPMINFLPVNSQGQRVLTYSFMQEFPNYPTGEAVDNDPPEHFSPFNAVQRANVRLAFVHLEEILNLQFVEIADTATNVFGQRGGIFRFGEYGLENSTAAAFAFFPGMAPQSGDSWYNRINMGPGINLIRGTGGFSVLLHEMGHAMGLKHPHDGFGRLPESIDTSDYTVMSYNDVGSPPTYQLYDIHQLQRLYGANTQFASGDNFYSPQTIGFREWTIWDTGGSDILSGAGLNGPVRIDLRQGNVSTFGNPGPQQSRYRISIGTNIEHAWGGNGNDILIGNHLNNVLVGNDGDDYLWGGRGNDNLRGGAGNDTYEFGIGEGFNVIDEQGMGGTDTLVVSPFIGLNLLQEDIVFRRVANDLVVDLRLNGGDSQGVARITNHYLGNDSEVERLTFNGVNIDLLDLSQQINGINVNHRFQVTLNMGAYGLLVTPA
jgi:hypothetical protein